MYEKFLGTIFFFFGFTMKEKFRDAFLKAIFCLFVLFLLALKPHLLPHDDIEALAGLVGEHDA